MTRVVKSDSIMLQTMGGPCQRNDDLRAVLLSKEKNNDDGFLLPKEEYDGDLLPKEEYSGGLLRKEEYSGGLLPKEEYSGVLLPKEVTV